MIKDILRLYAALGSFQRKQFFYTLGLFILIAILEMAMVISIGPFIKSFVSEVTASNLSIDEEITWWASPAFKGLFLIALIFCSSLLSIFATWRISLYAASTGNKLGDTLYGFYLQQPVTFFDEHKTADLIKQISTETHRITFGIIQPVMVIISRSLICFAIILYLIITSTIVVLTVGIVLLLFYLSIYSYTKTTLIDNGAVISTEQSSRFNLMLEGFSNNILIKLRRANIYFFHRFSAHGQTLSRALALNSAIAASPRYLIEFIALVGLIGLILFETNNSTIQDVLPKLSILALATMRLLPNFQQVFASVASIRGNVHAISQVINSLENSVTDYSSLPLSPEILTTEKWQSIGLRKFSYGYGNDDIVFDHASFAIERGRKYAIVGPSGSGKSTLVELLIGLRACTSGDVLLDGKLIKANDLQRLHHLISYVPQKTTLLDASIGENIAFASFGSLNLDLVWKAAEAACLTDEIKMMKSQMDEKIGEDGELLSGGQRQRLALARALYNQPDILILDEVTSALDQTNANNVMKNIMSNKEMTVIMITHKLTDIHLVDTVLHIDNRQLKSYSVEDYKTIMALN